MKNTVQLIFIAFVILPSLFLASASADTIPPSKPNIIFIMADDLGKMLLTAYGANPVIKMPNLEQLANEGVVFKNAYATPFCFSTRAKLVSGRASLNTGAYHNEFPARLTRVVGGGRTSGFYKYFYKGDSSIAPFIDPQHTPSFALPLQQTGYATAVVGKWHLNDYIKQPHIFRAFGFDQWMMYMMHNGIGAHTDKGFMTTSGFIPEKATDFIIDFITGNKNKPFFVYFPMHLAHHPYEATPLNPNAKTTNEKMISMIEYIDLIIGRLIKTLEVLNLREQTIIFVSGDNGDAGDYRSLYEFIGTKESETKPFRGKGTLHEGGVNVPLIVSGGPVVQRGETEALVDFTDILPTLADFANVPVVRKKRKNDNDYRGIAGEYVSVARRYKGDGYSIAPFLTGQSNDTPRDWIMFASRNGIVIRENRFKLWAKLLKQKNQGYALYDLYKDPYELTNLYNSKEPTVIAAQQRLENILESLPKHTKIDAHFDPVDWNYGLLAHWSMDQPRLPTNTIRLIDAEGGYDAESNTEVVFKQQGKFNEATTMNRLYAPYSNGLFYNFVLDSNDRFVHRLRRLTIDERLFFGSRTFFIGVRHLITAFNATFREYANTIFNWISPDEYPSRKGDREKFLASMTVSAWIKTSSPKQNIHLLKQPYIDKKGNLVSFSITKDAAINFELTTNDKTHSLESETLDKQLWREWMHVAATWDGRDDCGKAILYVNAKSIAQACLGKPLSADGTDNLLLGGFTENHQQVATALIDDIAIWRQPLMPVQIEALYELGNRFSYNASEVDSLFNTSEEDGTTKIRDDVWRRAPLKDAPDATRLIIRESPSGVEVQFGEVMAIRSKITL